jgi:VanZ family protein
MTADLIGRALRGTQVVLALYWGALFLGTHIPQPELLPAPDLGDKTLHFLGYLVLAFLFCLALRARGAIHRNTWIMVVVVLALYGAFDELSQKFVPGRFAEVLDWVADVSGAVVGCLLFAGAVFLWRRLRRESVNRDVAGPTVTEMASSAIRP